MALVLRSWLAILTVLSGVQGEVVQECTDGAGGDVVGLLQKGLAKRHLTAEQSSFGGPAWKTLESLLDTTMADLVEVDSELTGDGGEGDSDSRVPVDWSSVRDVPAGIFDRMMDAANASGTITPRMRSKLLSHEASKACKNLTKGDLREALALIAELRPKLARYLLKYNDIVVFSAWTGRRPPLDTPEPTQKERTVSASVSPSLVAVDGGESVLDNCTIAIIGVVPSAVSLLLNTVGVDLPVAVTTSFVKAINTQLKSNSVARKTLATLAGKYASMGTASFLYEFVTTLYNQDILLSALDEAFASLSWWDYTMIAVPAIANIAAFFLSSGVVAAINVGVGSFELTMAIGKMTANCVGGQNW